MSLYKFKTIDEKGKTSEGTIEAKDKFDLYHNVKKPGVTIVSTEEVKGHRKSLLSTVADYLDGVKAHDKIIFAKNLSKMLNAGLSITRGLTIMENEAKGGFKKVLISINQSLSTGKNLSDSMKDYPRVFSPLFVSMIRAGEESGNLSLALENVSLQLEKTYQLNKKIRGALLYPTVIVSLMIAIGVLMMLYVVPTLTSTFNGLGLKLPLSTRIIVATSNFLVSYFMFVVLGLALVVLLIVILLRTKKGKRFKDYLSLHIPVVGDMVRQINAARTARTLSSLLSSGVDIVVSIGVTKDVIQNSYYKEVLDEAQTLIQKGDQISKTFSSHGKLYPLFVTEMVSVGEETGKIGDMLLSVALFYEEEIDQKTKDLSSIIEPLLMVFIGIAVGLFAISIISPIYSIGDSIK